MNSKDIEIVSFTVDASYNHIINEQLEDGMTKIIIRMTYYPSHNTPDAIRKQIKLEIEKFLWDKQILGVKDLTYVITSPISKLSMLDNLLYNDSNYNLNIIFEKPEIPIKNTNPIITPTLTTNAKPDANDDVSSLSSISTESTQRFRDIHKLNVNALLNTPSIVNSISVKSSNSNNSHINTMKFETLSEAGTFVESYNPQTVMIRKEFEIPSMTRFIRSMHQ